MSEVKTIIKYKGPAVDGKSMDVGDLAPSLIALSDLLKLANKKFNGDRSGLTILVNADLEQNCFELGVELTQTLWENISQLIEDDRVKTAKEIAEWIGIVGGTIGTPVTLYKLIKLLKGKKVKSVTKLKQKDGKNSVQINIDGDHNTINVENNTLVVPYEVYELYADKNTRKTAVDVLEPLHKDGYESVEFYKGKKVFEKFDKKEVPEIDCSDCPEVIPENIVISNIRTVVRIRSAIYEGKSKWTLVYKKALQASMEDYEWLSKFQNNIIPVPPGTALDVELEETIVTDEHGEAIEEPSYRVIKVHSTKQPPEQMVLLEEDDHS